MNALKALLAVAVFAVSFSANAYTLYTCTATNGEQAESNSSEQAARDALPNGTGKDATCTSKEIN